MTKTKSTKHALIMSVMALFLCFTMLLGTTFAWFTDSVTSANNIIKSGNLDMKLSFKEYGAENTEWTEVKEDTVVFGKDAKYEPGYTEAVWLKVENIGSLAFRYNLAINVLSEKAGVNRDGKSFKLSDYLEVKYLNATSTDMETDFYTTRESLNSFNFGGVANSGVASLKEDIAMINNGVAFSKDDVAMGDYSSSYVLVIITMPETVGNEACHDGETIPEINFSLTALATQLSYEEDSFGSGYDAKAEYPRIDVWDGTADTTWYNDTDTEFTLSTAEQLAGLAELVDNGNNFAGKSIKLDADMNLGFIPAGADEPKSFEPAGSFSDDEAFEGTFDGQGHTISNLYQNGWALENGYWDGPEYGMGFFSLVENASIKNINFDGASLPSEANIMGVVAGGAANCVFENINVTDAYLGNHSWYSGGLVGWAEGEVKLINCDIDASSVVSSQWGDFNNANGGLIGGIDDSATILLRDCDVACVIDAYNDVTSAYEWYSYRNCGMLIGDTGQKDDPNGDNVGNAIAPNLTCENVTVTYGDWANYHYCQFGSAGYPFCRVEAGESTGAYGNARVGEYFDANGNKVVDDSHVHNDGEKHNELIVFDQLYGGATGDRYCTYGTATHDGVTVVYNNK